MRAEGHLPFRSVTIISRSDSSYIYVTTRSRGKRSVCNTYTRSRASCYEILVGLV